MHVGEGEVIDADHHTADVFERKGNVLKHASQNHPEVTVSDSEQWGRLNLKPVEE